MELKYIAWGNVRNENLGDIEMLSEFLWGNVGKIKMWETWEKEMWETLEKKKLWETLNFYL